MQKITRFKITKLFGFLDIDIPIRDNKLVLIGVNGTGKSTVLTMLFYFLGKEWLKLNDFDFEEIEIEINEEKNILLKKEIENFYKEIEKDLPYHLKKSFFSHKYLHLSEREYLQEEFFLDERLDKKFFDNNKHLKKLAKNIHWKEKTLFLPTYRRIEKELSDILPFLDKDIHKQFKNAIERSREKNRKSSVELIQFGMEDIQNKVDNILRSLKDTAGSEFKKLVGNYFKEIVTREDSTNYKEDIPLVKEYDEKDIQRILNRVDEQTLSTDIKKSIIKCLDKINSGQKHTPQDELIVHLFIQLAEIDKNLLKQEENINSFIAACNRYFRESNKALNYNNQDFILTIDWENQKQKDIKFKNLSSGEKQIVSIFSDLYLESNNNKYIIIVDEPELSLSVEWQKMFLADIVASKKCEFLAVATHSPFIFDNNLNEYVIDIKDCSNDNT